MKLKLLRWLELGLDFFYINLYYTFVTYCSE